MTKIRKLFKTRIGQSLTSTVIGVAVLGMVGAATASMISTHRTADSALSASADAAAILDAYTSEIRSTTPYHEIESKYDGKSFDVLGGGTNYTIKTTVSKVCNTGSGNTNCDMKEIFIDIYDKGTGEKVTSQIVKRTYTHFAESKTFTAAGSLVLPDDTIGFSYESEGKKGSAGTGTSATSAFLQVRSKACATNYQPNSAGTACVACPAPSGTKQYRSGDCTIGTCGTGKKANAARTGCEAITCPSGKHLEGDSCVEDVVYSCKVETEEYIDDTDSEQHGMTHYREVAVCYGNNKGICVIDVMGSAYAGMIKCNKECGTKMKVDCSH